MKDECKQKQIISHPEEFIKFADFSAKIQNHVNYKEPSLLNLGQTHQN